MRTLLRLMQSRQRESIFSNRKQLIYTLRKNPYLTTQSHILPNGSVSIERFLVNEGDYVYEKQPIAIAIIGNRSINIESRCDGIVSTMSRRRQKGDRHLLDIITL